MTSPLSRTAYLVSFLCCTLLLVACNPFDDLSKAELPVYTPEIAIPLFNTSLSLKDMVESSGDTLGKLLIDPDGSLTYTYTGDTIKQSANDLLKSVESTPVPVFISDTIQIYTIGALTFNGFGIVSGDVKAGKLAMSFNYNFRENVTGTLTLPNFTKNGKPLTVPINATYTGETSKTISLPTESLAGYRLQTEKGTITFRYTAKTASGKSVKLNNFFGSMSGLSFGYLEATSANANLAVPPGKVPVELYKYAKGSVYFTDPRIVLWIQNSFGFPVRIKGNAITAITKDGREVALTSPLLEKGLDIAYPKANEDLSKFKTSRFVFDKTNSNIAEIIASQVVEFRYNVSVIANPDKIPNLIARVSDASALKSSVTIELPLNVSTSGFEGDRAVRLDAMDAKNVQEAEFKMVAENQMPLAVSLQVYFASDSKGNFKIDSLFQKGKTLVIDAASPSNALSTKEKTTFITVDADRMNRIRSAPFAIIRTQLATFNNGALPVSIYASQKVKVRMGAKLKIKN